MTHRLDRARWNVLSPLLDHALELAPPDRAAWLEERRAQDPILTAEIEGLLAQYDRLEGEEFLLDPPAPRATLAGQVLGAYTLREPIGHGGMGTVWKAERTDGRYEGVAAVKLLNASLIGQNAETRFRREGSILARLRHRHIAQLIDAGVSPAGQPYLVLEHVEGEHIDDYCNRLRLDVPARVRLFLDVLAAVAHAHANLIVHRDLKPSNVLVDREGEVKLLDFGVAKLLAPDAEATLTLTRDGAALTPEYAAPEQLTGGDITTATDVYALGVLLYVLLSGAHPAKPEPNMAPGELIRSVLEREPSRLSSAAADRSPGGPEQEPALAMGTTPQGLRRMLKGDLETIAARALKKVPAERYASVGALADDLRRHLEHVPIAARPDSLGYRAGKFVRRNRLTVALSVVLLAALAAGLAGTAWQARQAARQRDLALAQLGRSESINRFATFLLGEAVPGGTPVRVSDILARGEQLASRRGEDDPGLGVDLLLSIGTIYLAQEDGEGSRRALKRAYELARNGADPATRAEATCAFARALAEDQDHAGAERLIAEGLALTSSDERFDGAAAACLLHRSSIAMDGDRLAVVSASNAEALRRLSRDPRRFADLRATALHASAVGLSMAGRTADANRAFAEALDLLRRLGREQSIEASELLHNWAVNAANVDSLDALEKFGRLAHESRDDLRGQRLPTVHNYAVQLLRVGRAREARLVLERVQATARERGLAQALVFSAAALARACRELGDLACAHDALRAAQDGLAGLPTDHGVRGDLALQQALLAEAEGRRADVRPLLIEALRIYQPLGSGKLIETLLELARFEVRQGSPVEAEARAREALGVAERLRGGEPRSSWVGLSQMALADARRAQADDVGARELARQALDHMVPTLGGGHPRVIAANALLGRLPDRSR
jgi:serine/threonine protein kinase